MAKSKAEKTRAKSEAQRRRREAKRAARQAATPPPAPPSADGTDGPPVEPLPLETAADALAVLREQVNRVRAGGDHATCRTLSYALAVALRAIEVSDLAVRMAALEAAEAARKGRPT